jgi:class 3 adenylate cyclase
MYMICPNCKYSNPDTNRYCGNCGKLLSRDCPNCGAANPPSYKFCGNCGFALSHSDNKKEPPPQVNQPNIEESLNQSREGKSLEGLKGERRIATVMVADVKKSTELLTRIGSEAWVDLMSKLLQVMEAQIYRYEGQVDQFRGDGLVAFFGARDAHEDDPERAILAALAMQEAFEQYKCEFEPFNLDDAKLRIGINTNELIVARIGTKGLHREETAMGKAVALAARLETAAEPGTILVSESTQNLTAERFHWMDLSEIELKGIHSSQHVYRPIAVRTDTELLQDLQNYMPATPLIGRYEEYDQLRQGVDQVMDDEGGVIFIAGERGLGKSFLVRQVYQNLIQQKFILNSFNDMLTAAEEHNHPNRRLLWLQGWCSSYEKLSPFFLWRILLKSWLGFQSDQDEHDMFNRLEIFCEELWSENYQDHLIMLASLLSILPEELTHEIASLDSKGYLGKVFFSIREWLVAISKKVPLVISLRSVQWANSASIDLLHDVITLSRDHPILWLVDYRPEDKLPIQQIEKSLSEERDTANNKIVLHPLDEEESQTLIEYILQPSRLDMEILQKIVEKAEGNPYFIRELVNNLIDEGILVNDESSNRWQLTSPIDSTNLPDSLQSLFLSRIDKLSTTNRLILQMASAIGYLFWARVIKQIVPADIRVEEGLEDLKKTGFIENRSINIDLGTTYAFSSTLIRDVAYESILSSQKRELHAKIADFLRNYIEDQEISPSLVAFHYQLAGNLRLELLYRIDAAIKSSKVFANEEAYQAYSRALTILDLLEEQDQNGQSAAIDSQRFELVKGRIEILYYLGRVFEAQSEAKRLLVIAGRIPDDPVWRIDALLMQPGVNYIENKDTL